MLKKKIWANFQRIKEIFNKKIVKKLLKIWSWDPGSGIRDPGSGIRKKPIPDPGSRSQKAPNPGSRIPDPDPQHWFNYQDLTTVYLQLAFDVLALPYLLGQLLVPIC